MTSTILLQYLSKVVGRVEEGGVSRAGVAKYHLKSPNGEFIGTVYYRAAAPAVAPAPAPVAVAAVPPLVRKAKVAAPTTPPAATVEDPMVAKIAALLANPAIAALLGK